MSQLARIFLQMKTGDADPFGLSVHFNINPAVQADRLVILRNLVRFWRIGVKIVLAVEFADIADRTVKRHCSFHRVLYGLAVKNRQYAGVAETDWAGMCIGRSAEFCGAAAEDFGLGMKLHMNFKPDDRFIFRHR